MLLRSVFNLTSGVEFQVGIWANISEIVEVQRSTGCFGKLGLPFPTGDPPKFLIVLQFIVVLTC